MIHHHIFILLLRTFIILLKDSNYVIAMEFKYPVRNLSAFIIDSKLSGFFSQGRGNYTYIISSPNFVYAVSNRTELLKLSKSSWRVIGNFSYKMPCTKDDYCEQININFVELNKERSLLWFCFSSKVLSNNVYQEDTPYCYIPAEEKLDKISGRWKAQTYTSSDFDHKTVTLTVTDYIYSGLYYSDKQLHVYKNPISFSDAPIYTKVVGLPTDFLRGPGEFIFSFQHKGSIYFLLLETDFRCGFWSHQLQTRLLRICSDDIGRSNNEFTAMAKINVNCQQKSYNTYVPSYTFEVASSASWMPKTEQLVISFMKRKNEASSAALCIYSINSIDNAFNSDFQKFSDKSYYQQNSFKDTCLNYRKNALNSQYPNDIYVLSKTYPLRRKILTNFSFFIEVGANIQHISSDEIILSKRRQIILWLGVEYNQQSAIMTMSVEPLICISEKFLTFEKITFLELINDQKPSLYIGTSQRITVLPVDRCKSFLSEDACNLNVYCGWNIYFKICIFINVENEMKIVSKSLKKCPQISEDYEELNLKVTQSCTLYSANNPNDQIGLCTCQKITSNGVITSISVSNYCTVDGGWSSFSEWSDCSVTCDNGFQGRSRNCDNPTPKLNGNICKGLKTELRPCEAKFECLKKENIRSLIQLFSDWSLWSTCSKTCGISFKVRTRYCLSGNCEGTSSENKLCPVPKCEGSTTSEWSIWSKFINSEGSRKRLRFKCSQTYDFQPLLLNEKVIIVRNNQSLKCTDDQCFIKNGEVMLNESWKPWSLWSKCSMSCGVGISVRSRKCNYNQCLGSNKEYSKCNVHPCKSIWSCWSKWSECSLTCETPKIKTRRRYCISDTFREPCVGIDKEVKECTLIPCTYAYGQWSIWSLCTVDGVIVRTRKCKSKQPCLFSLMQTKPCARSSTNKPVLFSSIYMIVSALLGLLVGVIIGAIICYIWWRCTILVLHKTHSGSIKFSTQNQLEDVYNSQSLNTIPDTGSSFHRQRSISSSDNYYLSRSIPQFRDEDGYIYQSPRTFFDYNPSHSAFRQPLPEVSEN